MFNLVVQEAVKIARVVAALPQPVYATSFWPYVAHSQTKRPKY